MPPRLARLVAIVAAIALVGGAFVLRGVLGGDDEGSAAGGAGGDGGDGPIRVICDEDLGDACDAIAEIDDVDPEAYAVMTASEAVAAMSEGDEVPYDVWVTLDPWPQILDVARDVDGLAALSPAPAPDEKATLASSTVVTLTSDGATACDAPVTWSCLAEGVAGGDDIGLPTLRSAAGTLVLADAAVGLVGRVDFGIDAVTDTDVGGQLSDLRDSADPGTLLEQDAVATRPGEFDALATIDGLASSTASTRQGQQRGLVAVELETPATLGVVAAPLGADGPSGVDRLREALSDQTVGDALAQAGWAGGPSPTEGLPEPDVLYRLNEEFQR